MKIQRFVFLSDEFYKKYSRDAYPEIEHKQTRPYIQILVKINNVLFALPLRSNINHPHVFWTDKTNHCGIDFSKAVVITDKIYVDSTRIPRIRQNEFDALRGKDYRIQQRFIRYIIKYKKAKAKPQYEVNRTLCHMSTLKYFEEYIKDI